MSLLNMAFIYVTVKCEEGREWPERIREAKVNL